MSLYDFLPGTLVRGSYRTTEQHIVLCGPKNDGGKIIQVLTIADFHTEKGSEKPWNREPWEDSTTAFVPIRMLSDEELLTHYSPLVRAIVGDRLLPKPSSWDQCLMEMAYTIRKMSKDPSTQVGAVLVSPDHCSMSVGYNGFVSGIPDRHGWWMNKDKNSQDFCKYDLSRHAERNALTQAPTKPIGWSMYVTICPCLPCANEIVAAKISKVFYSSGQEAANMDIQMDKVKRLFDLASVTLIHLPYEQSKETNPK